MIADNPAAGSNWEKYTEACNSPLGLVICPWLVLAAAFANFLHYNNYPVFDTTSLLVFALLLVPVAPMAFLYHRATRISKLCLLILFSLFALEFLYSSPNMVYIAIAGTLLFRERTLPLLTLVCIVTILTLPMLGKAKTFHTDIAPHQADESKPAIIHIVLDEHIGVEGLSSMHIASNQIEQEIRTFYLDREFTVFGGAYSSHFHTINSLPAAFNFSEKPSFINVGVNNRVMEANAYFDQLETAGYKLDVIQTDWVDYCRHSAVLSCTTYPKAGPFTLPSTDLSVPRKAKLAIAGFLSLSDTFYKLVRIYDLGALKMREADIRLPVIRLDRVSLTSTIAGYTALGDLEARLKEARPGQAWFAHALFPHYPYAYDSSCKLLTVPEWENRRSPFSTLEVKEAGYFDQLRCTLKVVDRIYQTLHSSPAGDNFILVLHGDHGARLNKIEPVMELIDRFAGH